jgi:excisionase family DNA binding protein
MRASKLQEADRLAYPLGEAAELLGYSRNGFAALLKARVIPSFKQGRKRLVRRSDLLAFMERGVAESRSEMAGKPHD